MPRPISPNSIKRTCSTLRSPPISNLTGISTQPRDYHQDFLTCNPRYPYIVVNDLPKIENLKRLFPDLYRATPVLVAAATPRN